MVDQVEESIQVIASEPSDRTLVHELLLETAPCPDFPRRGVVSVPAETAALGDGSRFATIVCHRSSSLAPYPRLPGLDVCGRVVVLSDCLDESVVVATLEAGAHHYFDIAEPRGVIKARLAAALRSHSRRRGCELTAPPFRFDLEKRQVWHGGATLELSPKEFDLAYYLFSHRGRVVGNQELMTAVWSLPRSMDSRRIDTAACRIRKKMGLEQTGRWQLRRLRGEGYQLVERASESGAGRVMAPV